MSRVWQGLAMAIALAAMTAGGVVITQQGGGDGEAHAFVNTTLTGDSCTRSSSPIDFATAEANGWLCSWDQALDICQSGDSVIVKGGSYGSLVMSGPSSRASGTCTVSAAEGETVTMTGWQNGRYTGGTGHNYVTFVGPFTTEEFDNHNTVNTIYDGWIVDGNYNHPRVMSLTSVNGTVFKNGIVRESCAVGGPSAQGAMIWFDGSGGVTFDNNLVYDAHLCDPTGVPEPHTECLYLQGPDNVTITRNHFYRCAVMDVFVTGEDTANNLYVENNVFGRPCSDNVAPPNNVCDTPGGAAFKFRDGSSPAPVMVDGTIRHNTFKGSLDIANGATGTNFIKGNIFLSGSSCPTNTTYSYNAHVSGSCGGTGSFNDAGLASDFVDGDDYAADGGDWTPISGGAQVDVGNTADYPALDLLGTSRYVGSAPDIGAVERP